MIENCHLKINQLESNKKHHKPMNVMLPPKNQTFGQKQVASQTYVCNLKTK